MSSKSRSIKHEVSLPDRPRTTGLVDGCGTHNGYRRFPDRLCFDQIPGLIRRLIKRDYVAPAAVRNIPLLESAHHSSNRRLFLDRTEVPVCRLIGAQQPDQDILLFWELRTVPVRIRSGVGCGTEPHNVGINRSAKFPIKITTAKP